MAGAASVVQVHLTCLKQLWLPQPMLKSSYLTAFMKGWLRQPMLFMAYWPVQRHPELALAALATAAKLHSTSIEIYVRSMIKIKVLSK